MVRYPRPDGRGPIEARHRFQTPDQHRETLPIRDLTVAAPLKLTQRHNGRPADSYPRPDGRGPIEAVRSGSVTRIDASSIRDLTVAAPLKHPTLDNAVGVDVAIYPRPDGRGPIEASHMARVIPWRGRRL